MMSDDEDSSTAPPNAQQPEEQQQSRSRPCTSWPMNNGNHPGGAFRRPGRSALKVATQSASLQSSWESSSHVPKNVLWKDVHIRHYERIVGDNPSCSSGPPLSIGWEYDPSIYKTSIDGYETLRPPRKSQFEMVLSREERREILINDWKRTQKSIADAVRNNVRVKNQRRQTVNNLSSLQVLRVSAELTESLRRKLNRAVRFEKRPSHVAEELERQHLAAERQREELWRSINSQERESRKSILANLEDISNDDGKTESEAGEDE